MPQHVQEDTQQNNQKMVDVGIVGAGIAGLTLATELEAKGLEVALVDKGRGYGGRMATRRIENIRLDHGTQYFTAQSPDFQATVSRWESQDLIRTWFDTLNTTDNCPDTQPRPRYIPKSVGMTALPKALADALNAPIHLGQRIVRLQVHPEAWGLVNEVGETLVICKQLVITAPLPQTLALFQQSGIELELHPRQTLESVRYAPSLAWMILTENPYFKVHFPNGLRFPEGEPLSWMACNVSKYQQESPLTALTLHASADFSKQCFEASEEDIWKKLFPLIHRYTQVKEMDILVKQLHRWRYAFAENPLESPVFQVQHPLPLWLAGDAFGVGTKIESAWRSGFETARAILS